MKDSNFYKKHALVSGWNIRDIQRVYKKIKELCKDGSGIEYDNAEMLAYILEEPLDYKLPWTLIRLIKEEKIFVNRLENGMYEVMLRTF